MPTGEIASELSKTISQLSKQYSAPLFPPHMTLMGDIYDSEKEMIERTQQLASRIHPFQVTLTTVDYLDVYFRCLFLRAEETPALLQANQVARTIFHREQEPRFMPHLSLLYGNFDVETKKQMIETIGREFRRTFPVTVLHLFSTTGETKEWYRVQEFEIPGR